jgi:hypothetical protein
MKTFFKVMGGLVAVSTAAFFLFTWASFGFWPVSSVRGWAAARVDLARGHYRVLGYGLPPMGMPRYTRLLRDRYGVEYQVVAACIVSKGTLDYVAAYDEESVEAIDRRFGRDVLTEVANETFSNPRNASAISAEKLHAR